MGFTEDIKEFSIKTLQMKNKIQTEEATKMSMVLPFFSMLGYDVFNVMEFCPEYTADVGIKKGEKVDYAILFEDVPVILIECKWCGEPLEKHGSQLFRYFGTTEAKFGILTNGVVYRFFTDLDETNKMDLTPFLEIDLENLKENYISELKKFCKINFDKENIFSTASELKYSALIKELLQREMDNPTDDFTRFLLMDIYDGAKTQKVVDKFKPIVKKSFSTFINELINQKISTALKTEDEKGIDDPTIGEPEKAVSKIITTQEELESYYIILGMLADIINVKKISHRDTESYFSILFDDNNRKPICRLNLDGKKKILMLPDTNKAFIKNYLDDITDLYKYKQNLIEIVQRYID